MSEQRVMTEQEVIHLIKCNLFIDVQQNTEFGPVEEITVKLMFGDEVIDESSCTLPEQDALMSEVEL